MLRGYLHDVGRQLHLEPGTEDEILRELQTHIQDKAQELIDQGLAPEEAYHQAQKELGQPRGIAQAMYAVHSPASWRDTIIAVLPHLLFSFLFAFHLWTKVSLLVILLMVTALVSLKGWRNGRPNWTYPWLGYSLLAPIVSWVLALVALAYGAWSLVVRGTLPLHIPIYLASLIYIPISFWIMVGIFRNVVRRDWLLASLASFPFPFLAFWLLYFNSRGKALEPGSLSLRDADASTAIVFLVLAISTAIFYRIGRRLVRVILLIITTPPLIILAWMSYQGGPGYPLIFLYALASVLVLLTPALAEQRLGQKGEQDRPLPDRI